MNAEMDQNQSVDIATGDTGPSSDPSSSPSSGPSLKPMTTSSNSSCNKSQSPNLTNNISHNHRQNIPTIEQQLANGRKELESMVLKYARSEREVLQNKDKIDDLDKKLKRVTKDNETLLAKVKALNNEKSVLISNLNSKIVHISRCEQDNERLNLDLSIKSERLEVVLKQFETEQEVHQLTRKQLTQAKESVRRMQIKLDQKQHKHEVAEKTINLSDTGGDNNINTNNNDNSQKDGTNYLEVAGSGNNSSIAHDGQHDHDSAIFTNTTSEGDSLDHSSNDKDNMDSNIESLDTKDSNTHDDHNSGDENGETIEFDRSRNNTSNNNHINHINNSNNIKQTNTGPSLQEQQRVIEMARFERKIMQLRDENHDINNRLKNIEKLHAESESSLSKYKQNLENSNSKIKIITEELDRLKAKLCEEEQNSSQLNSKLAETELINIELEKQIESYKSKEGELLEFTERLSLKQAMLQSELNAAIQKVPQYEERFNKANRHSEEVSKQKECLTKQIHKLKQELIDERKTVEKITQEKDSIEHNLTKSIDELQNEIRVIKKKHINSTKELNKELKNLQNQLLAVKTNDKRMTGLNDLKSNTSDTVSVRSANLTNNNISAGQPVDCASSVGSRTSSSTSLENVSSVGQHNVHYSHQQQMHKEHNLVTQQESADSTGSNNASDGHHSNQSTTTCKALHDYDKSSLVDWVVKLQRHIVKRDERIDILQEQINQLIEEVKKKGRLLQHFILREESGLLSTDSMEKNKQQLAKRGSGIMSSLYSSSANDSGLTLELSLEINKKLQALLEDTILKNITLKESLSTLGGEIARLNINQDPQQQQQQEHQ